VIRSKNAGFFADFGGAIEMVFPRRVVFDFVTD